MIIQKLLLIESEAQDAMRIIEEEQAHLAKNVERELAHRIAELEKASGMTTNKFIQTTEEKTTAAIDKIKIEYRQKRSALAKSFAKNYHGWVDKVYTDILTDAP